MGEIEAKEKPVLYLIDGSNYLFRAFYAIRELSNSKGFPTNAIYGFTNMLLKLLREKDPEYIAVTFDLKGPTFRHEAYKEYKATRKAVPEAIIPQIPYVKEIVRAFGIPVVEQAGIEADDIIGTLARTYADQGMRIVIASGDKDLMQLVSDDVVLIDTMKDKCYDVAAVRERFGVEPPQVVDVLALAGDVSDNIPGVPGIGPKGASRLIQEFGSVENVLNNIQKIKNGRAKVAIETYADQARMSLGLTRIRLDAEVDFRLEDSRRSEPDMTVLKRLFGEFEFSSLLQDLKLKDEVPLAGEFRTILDESSFQECLKRIEAAGAVSIEPVLTSTEPMRARILGIAVCTEIGVADYIPLGDIPGDELQAMKPADVWKELASILADDKIRKFGHDLKSLRIVLGQMGIDLRGIACDTLLCAYLLNPSRRSFELSDILRDSAGSSIPSLKDLVAGSKVPSPETISTSTLAVYAGGRANAVFSLVSLLMPLLVRDNLERLFSDLEMPLLSVLADMERHGVLLDLRLLSGMSQELRQLMDMSIEKIYRLAGERFNIQSSKQLQVILFEKMGLPRGRKTKEGYSTDVDVLSQLAKSHELPGEILSYRSLAKLKSTYIDALPLLVHPETGRVHTSYNQAVAATGRLSSSNPNLQNIPIRTLEGKRIRQAFIAPAGWRILSADYSQIELRVLAHLSKDPSLLDSFASGEDVHSRTASNIFGVFPEMVNEAMRRQAKVINFGVLYGMSAFGLAKELDISQKLAQTYIDEYFERYAGVKEYLQGILRDGRRDGFVTTLMNRRRYLPELNADNASVRQFAERMAINTPIQGSAADLIKLAMLGIEHRLKERNLAARMIMQVHDELVFEVPEGESDEILTLVQKEMEGIVTLSVPLKVDIGCGMNWDEAHGS